MIILQTKVYFRATLNWHIILKNTQIILYVVSDLVTLLSSSSSPFMKSETVWSLLLPVHYVISILRLNFDSVHQDLMFYESVWDPLLYYYT